MTSERLERDLALILDDLSAAPYPDYIDNVLATTARRRQRPAWVFPERWLPMNVATQRVVAPRVPWRELAVVAVLAVLAAAMAAVLVGTRPRPSPAPPFGPAMNGLIPFEVGGDLFAGDPVTGSTQALLTGETVDLEPVYSRDGTKIAFRRLEDPALDSVFRLFVMDADGANLRGVTNEPLENPQSWDWTPDGRSLVVVENADGVSTLRLYDAAGAEPPRTLTSGIAVDVPSFRPPDGREILFRGQVGSEVGLFVMNADGSKLRELVTPTASGNLAYTLREPKYSPDGSQIAFHQWRDETKTMHLYVMDADGGERSEVGAREGYGWTAWPAWSNDGTRLAVSRGALVAGGIDLEQPWAVLDLRDNSIVNTGPPMPFDGGRIEWAPDDSKLLMIQFVSGSRQFLLDPAGGPWKEVPWDSDSWPSWQRLAP
jgi:Tol biopolymer transport system component